MSTNQHYNLTILRYDGNLPVVTEILDLIEKHYSKLFCAVIIHGSVATKEVIPYSDFDGLLIVKDDFINSNKLVKFKNESMKLILKFDPLQHHGWFQIKESDLLSYPESYLPISILEHSKLMYPKIDSITFNIKPSEQKDFKRSLVQILNQFENRIRNNWQPRNVYQLKSMLSQIMLIPCLYYSAVNNKGIFKRDSFDAVKDQFAIEEWNPIVIASEIRLQWKNEFSSFQGFLLRMSNPLIRKIVKKYMAPKINAETQSRLNSDFYTNLNKLIHKIKKEIQ